MDDALGDIIDDVFYNIGCKYYVCKILAVLLCLYNFGCNTMFV